MSRVVYKSLHGFKPCFLSYTISKCSPSCLLHSMLASAPYQTCWAWSHIRSALVLSSASVLFSKYLYDLFPYFFRFVLQYCLPAEDVPLPLFKQLLSQSQSSLTPLPCLDFPQPYHQLSLCIFTCFCFFLLIVYLSLLRCKLCDGGDFCLSCSLLNPHCLKCA